MSRQHADLEALSAFIDGEAPEWADHVAACAACLAAVDELRAVAAAVGAPVGPAPAEDREAAIAAALAAGDAPVAATRPVDHSRPVEPVSLGRRRTRPPRRWAAPAMAAAAAVVVGILGLSALVALQDGQEDQTTTFAGPALESAPQADARSGGSANSGAAGDTAAQAAVDLGDVPDAATLRARARVPVSGQAAAAGGAGASAAVSPTTVFNPPAAAVPAPARSVVGTRPCEEQARTRDPALREVVYFATARRGDVPAFVLGFATGPAPSPVTLLLLAQNGCAELLRAAAP